MCQVSCQLNQQTEVEQVFFSLFGFFLTIFFIKTWIKVYRILEGFRGKHNCDSSPHGSRVLKSNVKVRNIAPPSVWQMCEGARVVFRIWKHSTNFEISTTYYSYCDVQAAKEWLAKWLGPFTLLSFQNSKYSTKVLGWFCANYFPKGCIRTDSGYEEVA